MTRRPLRRPWSTLRGEGLRGLRLRVGERLSTLRASALLTSRNLESLGRRLGPVDVLNVLPFPLRPVHGGVAVTLADRLEVEGEYRAIALLHYDGRRWRLDGRRGAHRFAWRAGEAHTPNPLALEDAGFADLLGRVLEAVGARAIHFENLAGLPLATVAAIAAIRPTILSTHDFALFSPRPNLLEEPEGRFCGYSTDDTHCLRCLRASGSPATTFPGARRAAASELARVAASLVHPSAFARRETERLFPMAAGERGIIIPPAVRPRSDARCAIAWPPRRIAYVGQAFQHKGILEFEELVDSVRTKVPGLEWVVAGRGDPEILARLAQRGVALLGPYAPGRLPETLCRARVDLALLCSRFPETHSLALDECVRAGVPVLAAPVGALPERMADLRCGWVAEEGALAPAMTRRLVALLGGPRPPGPPSGRQPSTPAQAAEAHLELYRRLDLGGPAPGRP